MKKTLEQIITAEKTRRHEDGAFGIKACKEYITEIEIGVHKMDLYIVLREYVRRANEDAFFNTAMVLACWELINEQ